MCYYDHATAMAFNLDQWEQDCKLSTYQLEIEIFHQKIDLKQRFFWTRISETAHTILLSINKIPKHNNADM